MDKKLLAGLLILAVVFSGYSIQESGKNNLQEKGFAVREFKVKVTHAGYVFYSGGRPLLKPVANKGDRVRLLAITDIAEADHNHGIAIDEYGINEPVITANENRPKLIEFTADKEGKFSVWCKPCLNGSFGEDHPSIEAEFVVQ